MAKATTGGHEKPACLAHDPGHGEQGRGGAGEGCRN